jgi:hypothetical protein
LRARKPNRRRLITNPVEAYERALALGFSPAEAVEAARDAERARGDGRLERRLVEDDDRMVAARDREARSFWGLFREDL